MRILFLFVIISNSLILFGNKADSLAAFDEPIDSVFYDSLDISEEFVPDTNEIDLNFEENLDSTLNLFYVRESIDTDALKEAEQDKPVDSFRINIPDEVFIERLNAIPTPVQLSYNQIVKRYIEMYVVKKHERVEVMLGLADHYFPLFDDIFDYYDVPNEMKYMSIVESALNPRAYSRARAVGLWQFMYGTGRIYGLEVNSMVDDRRDPIKSTHAAARFVKDLYGRYGDWILVIAAYNCGPGNVNKAIRRAGGKTNYWEIYRYLPRETRGHIPAFIAATYVMNYYGEHNLEPVPISFPVDVDTVMIHDKLHFEQVSAILDIPMDQLRDLNPQYRYGIIPASEKKQYALRLPTEKSLEFIDSSEVIFAYKDSILFNEKKVTPPTVASSYYTPPPLPGKDYEKLVYVVKSGDNLGYIADWYDVGLSDIRNWNNIYRNTIRTDQKLAIYKKKSVADKYRDINNLSFADKQKREGKIVAPEKIKTTEPLKEGEYVIYTVRSGDTLWDIAKKFDDVTDSDIKAWNSLKNAGDLKVGQQLKIKYVKN